MADPSWGQRPRGVVAQADGRSRQRREHDTAGALVHGRRRCQRHRPQIDIRKWTFMNTAMAVHVHRIPEGEWIGIRAETNYGPDGIGTTIGTVFDETGAVGAIQQSVLVRPRPTR